MKRLIQFAVAAAVFLSAVHALATDYFVATNGNDTATGLATDTAWRTIQSSVNRLQAGDTLWIREGVYRGKVAYTNRNGRADAPIRVIAFPGEDVVLKGSVVVTGWVAYGNGVWRRPAWNLNSQQVFIDGLRLTQLGWANDYSRSIACGCGAWHYMPVGYDCRQIGSAGMGFDIADPRPSMPAGSFWYQASTGDLYLRAADDSDPNDHQVEISTENGVFYDTVGRGFLHLENLTFTHSSTLTYTQLGWPLVSLGPDSLLRNCTLVEGDGIGLWLSSRSRAENCRIADHGVLGVSMNYATDWIIDSCLVTGNNYRQVNLEYAAAMKFIPDSAGTVQNCEVRDNFASGIWFDTCNSGRPIIVRNNIVERNAPAPGRNQDVSANCACGIFIEISSNAQVYGNLVSDTGCIGIASSGSRNVRIFNNTIHNTRAVPLGGPRGHYALLIDRPSISFPVENVEVRNNFFADNACDLDIHMAAPDGYTTRGVSSDYNLLYRTVTGGAVAPSARAVFYSGGVAYGSLTGWSAATGNDAHSLSLPAGTDASLRPLAGSPLIDAGTPSAVPGWLDTSGLRGADGDGDGAPEPDIGAFEWAPASVRVLHVDAAGAAPASPYTNLASAATSLADAVAVAQAGDVILVEPGDYPVSAELLVDRPVIVRGSIRSTGAAVVRGIATNRLFRLDHPGAVLENLTLSNGRAPSGGAVRLDRGLVQDCRVENCSADRGGGVWAATGTVVRTTTFTGCSATGSGGALWLDAGARAESCTLESNTAASSGGGARVESGARLVSATLRLNQAPEGGGAHLAGGRAEKCLFDRNTASGSGGGARADLGGVLDACRLFDNQATARGGGLSLSGGASAVNLLVLRNRAGEGGGASVAGASISFCTLSANTATVRGGGLIAGAGAQCSSSIAHFNSAPADPQVAADDPAAVFSHMASPVALPGDGNVTGDPLFANRAGGDYRLSWGSPCIDAATAAPPAADIDEYERPRNGDADTLAAADIGAYESISVHYVDTASPGPKSPYAGWSTAARGIQEAVNVCRAGDVVLVAPGTYPLASTLGVGPAVRILSTGGAAATVLDGQNATRCVLMANGNAVLDGFTLRRGRANAGGGVYVRDGGTLRNCIIRECVSTADLGGAFAYLTANFPNPCTAYVDSLLKEGGGGAALVNGGVLENCLVYGNSAARAGGVLLSRGGEVRHCTVTGNDATVEGGGVALVSGGRVVNSIVWDNTGGVSSNLYRSGTQPVVRHTCAAPAPDGTGNFTAVPGWTGAADLFRLPAGSPCLDRGETSATTTDFSGAARPQDGDGDGVALPDPGAWERVRTPGDSDGDGLTDAEEAALGTNPALADTDGDQVPDPEEILLGTNPLAALSYLKLMPPSIPPAGAGYTLRWRSVPRHVYSIARGTNLLEGITGVIATNLPPTAPWNEYTDPGATGAGPYFYRIEGRDP